MSFIMQLYVDTTGWDIAGWIGGIFFTIVRPIEYLPWPFKDFAAWVKDKGSETSKELFLEEVLNNFWKEYAFL